MEIWHLCRHVKCGAGGPPETVHVMKWRLLPRLPVVTWDRLPDEEAEEHFHSAAEAQAESFRKMLLAMVKDLRVILVKLADRTHNMQTIDALPVEKRRRIAK